MNVETNHSYKKMLQPNCSETVVKINNEDIEKLSQKEKAALYLTLAGCFGSTEPVEDYSKLRPENDSEKCFYFYQSGGNPFITYLKRKGIKIQAGEYPFSYPEDEDYPGNEEEE